MAAHVAAPRAKPLLVFPEGSHHHVLLRTCYMLYLLLTLLLVFPEGSITNGRGLMRFSSFVFGLGVPVQPVAIRHWAPLPLASDTVWSPLHWNLVRMGMQPFLLVELCLLPPLRPRPDEDAAAFAARAAAAIATELRVPATPHTSMVKVLPWWRHSLLPGLGLG